MGDNMTFREINIAALKLNKNKYLSVSGINMFLIVIACILSFFVILSDRYISATATFNSTAINILRIVLFTLITITALVIFSGFSLGKTAVFSGRLNNKRATLKRIIYWLKPAKSLKAFCLNAVVFMLKTLWTTTFTLPGAIILFTIVYLAFTGGIEVYLLLSLIISGVLLITTGIIFAFIISQRYFLAEYLLTENPKLKVFQVIKQSKNLMEYQLMSVVKFKLSFILPFILSIFIFPLIFLYPHYKQSLSILAKELTV